VFRRGKLIVSTLYYTAGYCYDWYWYGGMCMCYLRRAPNTLPTCALHTPCSRVE